MSASTVAASGASGGVVALTLLAAVLHATWNAIAHGVPDRLIGFALLGAAYTVGGGLVALALGPPPVRAWPFVLASAVLHVVYMLLLWASYQLGDFSRVYPIARGTAPWVVAVIETALGRALPLRPLLGVALISLGLLGLSLDRGRLSPGALPAVGAAVATGVCIASYTVVDAAGVATTAVPVYAAWMFLLQGPVLPAIAVWRRGRGVFRQPRRVVLTGLAGGAVSLAAYGLVLVAQTGGATAVVAALRETGILVGVIIGAVVFRERLGALRWLAAAVVVAGVVMVDL